MAFPRVSLDMVPQTAEEGPRKQNKIGELTTRAEI